MAELRDDQILRIRDSNKKRHQKIVMLLDELSAGKFQMWQLKDICKKIFIREVKETHLTKIMNSDIRFSSMGFGKFEKVI